MDRVNRVRCSGEETCGCVLKRKGEIVSINESMKDCARTIQGKSGTKHCLLIRRSVHIMKGE